MYQIRWMEVRVKKGVFVCVFVLIGRKYDIFYSKCRSVNLVDVCSAVNTASNVLLKSLCDRIDFVGIRDSS